ncbi:MAG TPA: aldo/keto reductase, partial [Arachidicoccus soli]|nr:aldo/keto reductase [Arachidicoccus soli]
GLLTNKYLHGIPADSRAAKEHGFLKKEAITEERVTQLKKLNNIAESRGQSLAQMALSWILKDPRVTSVLVGASSSNQLLDSLKCLNDLHFEEDTLQEIENILK